MSGRVRLTWTEVARGAWTGIYRHIKARQKNRVHINGRPLDPWGVDIEGAIAELAFAKWCGVYWPGSTDPDRDDGDVLGYGVRSTTHEHGCLLLHECDADAREFVLLIGESRDWYVAGKLKASEGKRSSYWRTDTGRPAYFVPQAVLEPFDKNTVAA